MTKTSELAAGHQVTLFEFLFLLFLHCRDLLVKAGVLAREAVIFRRQTIRANESIFLFLGVGLGRWGFRVAQSDRLLGIGRSLLEVRDQSLQLRDTLAGRFSVGGCSTRSRVCRICSGIGCLGPFAFGFRTLVRSLMQTGKPQTGGESTGGQTGAENQGYT